MIPKRLEHPVMVRLDGDLYAIVEADAQDNERTVAATIRYHLRRSLEVAS